MSKIVRKVLTKKKVSAQRKRELTALAEQPDGTIDLSDIPEASDDFWQRAVRNPFYQNVRANDNSIGEVHGAVNGKVEKLITGEECWLNPSSESPSRSSPRDDLPLFQRKKK